MEEMFLVSSDVNEKYLPKLNYEMFCLYGYQESKYLTRHFVTL